MQPGLTINVNIRNDKLHSKRPNNPPTARFPRGGMFLLPSCRRRLQREYLGVPYHARTRSRVKREHPRLKGRLRQGVPLGLCRGRQETRWTRHCRDYYLLWGFGAGAANTGLSPPNSHCNFFIASNSSDVVLSSTESIDRYYNIQYCRAWRAAL
ncbi:uncharacterized protein BDV17DRAFT_93213 [Aspergillus undulatus]|uniref:uncharacterized protein n=1 Tax=Aspergillus undulatus TaxID=1810928 RepID=UPI003CCDDEB8